MKGLSTLLGSTIVAAAVSSCGVLEPAPPAAPTLSAPSVTPLITSAGAAVIVNDNAAMQRQAGQQAPVVADDPTTTQRTDARPMQTQAELGSESEPVKATMKPTRQIFQTDRCNQLSRGGFIWFTELGDLTDWLSPLGTAQAATVLSKIDFSKQGALLLDYGVAATNGSGAALLGEQVELKGQNAMVKVVKIKPPAGKRTAQVVTHPCSLHVMPRTGFSSLSVLSEMDDKLTSFQNK